MKLCNGNPLVLLLPILAVLHEGEPQLPKIQSVTVTPGLVGVSPNADPSIEVSWSAVDELPVSYVVRYSMQHGSPTVPPDEARQIMTDGTNVILSDNLAENKRSSYKYYIWVAAQSAGVIGQYSNRENVSTLNSPYPRNLRVSPNGCQSLRVTWTPRDPTPLLTLFQYRVAYQVPGSTLMYQFSPPGSSYTITGLVPATTYSVRVRGQTEVGFGHYCCIRNATTHNVGPPRMVSVEPLASRGAIRVTWSPPADLCGLTNPRYVIQYGTSRSSFTTVAQTHSSSPVSIMGLNVSCEYFVRVAIHGQSWNGNFSSAQSVTTYGVPSRTQISSVTKAVSSGSAALEISWTAPSSDVPISGYQISYRVMSGRWSRDLALPASTLSYLIASLQPNMQYKVRVRALSPIGTGRYRVLSETTYARAPYPDMVGATAVNKPGVIEVTWRAPSIPNGELPITGYNVRYRELGLDAFKNQNAPIDTTLAEVTGLHPGTEYQVYVASVNAIGIGEYCCQGDDMEIFVRTFRATPRPIVTHLNSTLHSISISWSVRTPEDVTNYVVLWLEDLASAVIAMSSYALVSTTYMIRNLLPNTAYRITVQASGELGNTSSTTQVLYTSPNTIKASIRVIVIPNHTLKVLWEPVDYARSFNKYIVNTTIAGVDGIAISTTVAHPITNANQTGLPQNSAGTVSVWAMNPGALSEPVIKGFKMVNIATNVSGVSAEWVDDKFTSLRVTLPAGDVYRISYVAMNKSNSNAGSSVTTSLPGAISANSPATIDGLDSECFYTLLVEVAQSDPMEVMDANVGIGIGTAVFVIVVLVILILLLGLCYCFFSRHKKYKGKRMFLPFDQRWTLGKSTLNEPVATADAVGPSVVDVDHVDLRVAAEPEYGNVDILINKPNPISKRLFPAHVREMHRNRDEGFEREFENIHDDPNGPDSMAKKNKSRNRYLNTHTFDHSRVTLKVPDENGSDYINASYIEGYRKSRQYVAAQGPKHDEISIFWQMIWEQKPVVVIMLTNMNENGKRKCEQYWNNDLDKPYDAGRDFTIVTTGHRAFADYEVRDLTINHSIDRPHKVTHFQYTSWPDHGVPLHLSSLVKFAQEVRKVHSNSQAPMVVHCSAGVGRTGTFITLDAMMERLKERDDLNIFEFVSEMRTRRKQMVQTIVQYAFIHDALSDFITCGDTSLMAHELRHAIHDMNKKDGSGKSGFENQFEFMGSVCKMPAGEDAAFARKSAVAKRNRYKDKYPYSTNYLHIAGRPPNNAANYINATMLATYSKLRGFVAAQSPLESTRTDVWELIWQLKTKTVVLLCPLKEGSTIMCSQFWPSQSQQCTEYSHLNVNFIEATPKPDWEMTTLQLSSKNRSSGSPLEVTLFHFLYWLRDGHPPIDSMLKMMGEVEKKQKLRKSPLMVMCDDGMSRTGVFITCMSEIERVKVEGAVDIFQTVKAARAQRPHMVYTSDQYKLCFEILQSYLDSFDTYANYKAV